MMRAAEGDMDAFEEIVLRHQQHALNIAYRFLGRAELAEDTTQEAFLRILASASRYRSTARFTTYLYNVIYHLCVDQYRRRRSGPLNPTMQPEYDGHGPADLAESAETSAAVRRAIDELPPRQRMALVLQHYEGLSYEEIGEALDCSAKAVDSLLIRAKRKLRDALQDLI
jgi:RNA polymerase sigma-70 factor (ECF subfamily)